MGITAILWTHALAAILFGGFALTQLKGPAAMLPRLAFVAALALTALWALAVAGIGQADAGTRLAEGARDLAWLGFMYALLRRDRATPGMPLALLYAVVGTLVAIATVLALAEAARPLAPLAQARGLLRMLVAVSALLLVQHLYTAVAPAARAGIRLVALALALLWGSDLLLSVTGYLGAVPPALVAGRGLAVALTAPLLGVAVLRNGAWELQLSRAVAWQSLSLGITLLYIVGTVLATGAIGAIGGPQARVAQTAFIFGSTAALLALGSSPWLRAWAKVKLAKHFFRHRYDYRAEWLRFTDTLGRPDDAEEPIAARIARAVAVLTDAPGAILLLPDADGLSVAAAWNWPVETPDDAGSPALVDYLAVTGRIIALDAVRDDSAAPMEAAVVPQWMVDRADAWALVPLIHFDRLAGAILLARPLVDRVPDWEDLDLLRCAGRQVATYLAEARSQSALAEARRFDEFNRRFAFIIHDIKNLVSQLALVARNAERHADNPEFRADMVVTLQGSVARMNDLLARLAQQPASASGAPDTVDLAALAARVAAARRAQHPILVTGEPHAPARADAARLDVALGHLVQNAIEASAPAEPVTLAVEEAGDRVTIAVIDRGTGMNAAFMRDELFRPFASSKPGGFGIGAFEARQMVEAMGGKVEVTSMVGSGTTFRIILPRAAAMPQGIAA